MARKGARIATEIQGSSTFFLYLIRDLDYFLLRFQSTKKYPGEYYVYAPCKPAIARPVDKARRLAARSARAQGAGFATSGSRRIREDGLPVGRILPFGSGGGHAAVPQQRIHFGFAPAKGLEGLERRPAAAHRKNLVAEAPAAVAVQHAVFLEQAVGVSR